MTSQRVLPIVVLLLAVAASALWWRSVHVPSQHRQAALRSEISDLLTRQTAAQAILDQAREARTTLPVAPAEQVVALWERTLSVLEAHGLRVAEATFAEAAVAAAQPAPPAPPGPGMPGPGTPGAPAPPPGVTPPPGPAHGLAGQPPGGQALLRRFTARILVTGNYIQVAPATRAASAAVPGLWWTEVRLTSEHADGTVNAALTAILVTSAQPIDPLPLEDRR